MATLLKKSDENENASWLQTKDQAHTLQVDNPGRAYVSGLWALGTKSQFNLRFESWKWDQRVFLTYLASKITQR